MHAGVSSRPEPASECHSWRIRRIQRERSGADVKRLRTLVRPVAGAPIAPGRRGPGGFVRVLVAAESFQARHLNNTPRPGQWHGCRFTSSRQERTTRVPRAKLAALNRMGRGAPLVFAGGRAAFLAEPLSRPVIPSLLRPDSRPAPPLWRRVPSEGPRLSCSRACTSRTACRLL
jgi:hypothetical protein